MLNLKDVRQKIRSVSNIRELTSALETLSALKMRKAQKIALDSRPFAEKTARLLEDLEPKLKDIESVFLKEREGGKTLAAVISSDRGFCGSFNQNILRFAEREIKELEKQGEVEVFPIGKKATAFFKSRGREIKFNFFGIGDFGELEEIKPISDFLVKSYLENKFQKIYIFYTDFISAFSQKSKKIQILPFKKQDLDEFLKQEILGEEKINFLVEPSWEVLLKEIMPQLVEYLIYQCILESNASEHSARMMAMKNASENAQKRVQELQLDYNKARQWQITTEVSEVSSAKEVLD